MSEAKSNLAGHDRVRENTSAAVNSEIRRSAARRIAALGDDPQRIRQRIDELSGEWDIERALEALSSSLTLAGLGAGLAGRTAWLRLPVVVQGFLLLHAVQGWCPPLPILRRLGFRTQQEIEEERYALLALLIERGARPGEALGKSPGYASP